MLLKWLSKRRSAQYKLGTALKRNVPPSCLPASSLPPSPERGKGNPSCSPSDTHPAEPANLARSSGTRNARRRPLGKGLQSPREAAALPRRRAWGENRGMLKEALTCRVGMHGAGQRCRQRHRGSRWEAMLPTCPGQAGAAWGHPAPRPIPRGPGSSRSDAHPHPHALALLTGGSRARQSPSDGRGHRGCAGSREKAGIGRWAPRCAGTEEAPWLAARAAALHPHRTRKYGQTFALLFFSSHVILFLDCYFGAGLQPR